MKAPGSIAATNGLIMTLFFNQWCERVADLLQAPRPQPPHKKEPTET